MTIKMKPYQPYPAILIQVIFSLLIAGTAEAKPLDISNTVWVTRDSAERITVPPDDDAANNLKGFKATLPAGMGSNPDKAEIERFFNPSYQFDPYMAIFDALDGKSVNVTTDGGVRATLVPVGGQDGVYDIVGTVVYPAAEQGSQPAAAHPLGRISTTDAHCVVYIQDGKPCFVFTDMTPELTLSFGGFVHVYDRWQDMRETPATEQSAHKDQQTYGNIFVAYPENFNFVRVCYDITTMDFIYLVRTGCTMPIFSDLSADTTNYQKITIDKQTVALPWGWTRVAANLTHGEAKTRSLDTASENQTSINTSVGFKASASIFGATAKSHLTVGVKEKLDKSRESKTSNSSYDIMMTDHAFILNRTHAQLSLEFKEAVKSLAYDKDYEGFIRDWGTHYAYATTFGQRSHRTLAMTEDQTATATESGINIDAGMKVGYKAMGQGGSLGIDVKFGEDQLNKIHNTSGEESESVVCYGGGGCDQGHLDGNARIPVQVDLRPISELLGPPFYFFPSDQNIYTRVHDELAQAIARKVFLSEQDSLQLGTNGTSYVVIRATLSSDEGVDIAKTSQDDPKFQLEVIDYSTWAPHMISTGMNPRPSANTSGVWIFPYSTIKPFIDAGARFRFYPHVEAKTTKGFTCSGVQLAEGTVLSNYFSGPGQFIFGSSLNSYSATYAVVAITPSQADYLCPNLHAFVSIKIVNSADELMAEVGTLQPRDDNQTSGN